MSTLKAHRHTISVAGGRNTQKLAVVIGATLLVSSFFTIAANQFNIQIPTYISFISSVVLGIIGGMWLTRNQKH